MKTPSFFTPKQSAQIVTFDNFNYFEGYENCFPTDAVRMFMLAFSQCFKMSQKSLVFSKNVSNDTF